MALNARDSVSKVEITLFSVPNPNLQRVMPTTHDPSSPPKFLVPETRTRNLDPSFAHETHKRKMASDDSDDDAVAAVVLFSMRNENKLTKKRKRSVWVQAWIEKRPVLGAYHALLQELQCSDEKSMHNIL